MSTHRGREEKLFPRGDDVSIDAVRVNTTGAIVKGWAHEFGVAEDGAPSYGKRSQHQCSLRVDGAGVVEKTQKKEE